MRQAIHITLLICKRTNPLNSLFDARCQEAKILLSSLRFYKTRNATATFFPRVSVHRKMSATNIVCNLSKRKELITCQFQMTCLFVMSNYFANAFYSQGGRSYRDNILQRKHVRTPNQSFAGKPSINSFLVGRISRGSFLLCIS